jgi:hypothetical protein
MRALICLCLATGLAAVEPPQPGRERAFLVRILADSEDGTRPWKTFKVPEASASAVVEVVGELTREELRQVTFQEFLVWFQADLRRFWRSHGFDGPPEQAASASLPVSRSSGNYGPLMVPLGRSGL